MNMSIKKNNKEELITPQRCSKSRQNSIIQQPQSQSRNIKQDIFQAESLPQSHYSTKEETPRKEYKNYISPEKYIPDKSEDHNSVVSLSDISKILNEKHLNYYSIQNQSNLFFVNQHHLVPFHNPKRNFISNIITDQKAYRINKISEKVTTMKLPHDLSKGNKETTTATVTCKANDTSTTPSTVNKSRNRGKCCQVKASCCFFSEVR